MSRPHPAAGATELPGHRDHGPTASPTGDQERVSRTGILRRTILAITALWVAVMLVWSVLLPTYRSPDEVGHVSNGYALLENGEWPGYQELELLTWVVQARPPEHAGYQALTTDTTDLAPSFADLREQNLGSPWSGEISTTGQHPPGYHALLAGALAVLPADVPAHVTVWWLRLGNVALLAPLPLLLALGARRLRAPPAAVVAAAACPLLIPQLGTLGAAVSNDNLMILTATAATILAVHAATGDMRRRIAVGAGVVLAAALFTKAFALLLVPLIGLAYLLGGWRAGALTQAFRRLGLIAALAATTGWWWVANLFRYGTVQPAGHYPPRPEGPLDPLQTLPDFLLEIVIRVPGRFFSSLAIQIGQQPPPFPYWMTTGLFALLLLLAVVVLVRTASFGMRRADTALLLLPFAASLAAMISGVWPLHLQTGLMVGLQGRYLYTGLAGLVLVVVLGVAATLPRRARWAVPGVILAGGGLYTLVSMRKVAGFHWAERDSALGDAMEALRAWAPAPDAVLWLVALAAAGAAVWVVASTVTTARRDLAAAAPVRA
ncbi:glycosyltransferase family 39 protein [Pseudactinotalea sp. Z1739]|uniref:glycosyltransferase family 39 protein n=1 Tax=Pseudactinotalea sp. Z1739 TaxID=3413028 RepID=UPI003C79804E